MKIDVYQKVTDYVIDKMKDGELIWNKSWSSVKSEIIPVNLFTGNQYEGGINIILLNMTNYKRNYWVTFKQCQFLGGKVKKGEKAHFVLYADKMVKPVLGEINQPLKDEEGETINKTIPFLKTYNVFNVAQTEGLEHLLPEIDDPKTCFSFNPIDEAESISRSYFNSVNAPKLKFIHKNQAYYNSFDDFINMPDPEQFEINEEYYSTLFHEIGHSTGHESRLNRELIRESHKSISLEELTAEFVACFLCAFAGIEKKTIDNSTAYIQSWMKAFKNDPKMIFKASKAAKEAVDFIYTSELATV